LEYTLFIERSAQKSLSKIDTQDKVKIEDAIEALALDPRPANSKKLTGRDAYRIRIGNYRVIYEVDDGKLIILVVRVGHRKDVYR